VPLWELRTSWPSLLLGVALAVLLEASVTKSSQTGFEDTLGFRGKVSVIQDKITGRINRTREFIVRHPRCVEPKSQNVKSTVETQLYFHSEHRHLWALYLSRLPTSWTVRGSNPGVGLDFLHQSRPALRPTQPSVQWVPGLSRG